MALEFVIPWLVIAAAAFAPASVLLAWRTRRPAPVLFTLAAGAFLLAGARPSVGGADAPVKHAVVLDVSGSMTPRLQQAGQFVDEALQQPAYPPGHGLKRYELSDALRGVGSPGGGRTDYARMVDLQADPEINGEVVLATDGRGSLPDLLVAVDPGKTILLRLPAPDRPDASVVTFSGPTSVPQGGTAILRGSIHCDRDMEVRWKIMNGANAIASGAKRLTAGVPAGVSFNFVVNHPGLVRLRLAVEVDGDREPRNDEASISFYSGTRRVVLYCVPEDYPEERDGLIGLLRKTKDTDVRIRNKLPLTPRELDDVGLLVINNLPLHASGATPSALKAIAEWVMAGGNLLMLGADGAFGPGGYRGTPVEDVMPVRFRPDDAPQRRILLLLDASDSMGAALPGGVTRLDRLREAARRVLDAASEKDAVGIAGFNRQLMWDRAFLAPDSPAHNAAIDRLQAAGGTSIYNALRDGLDVLAQGGPELDRRILLITDGEDESGASADDWAALARTAAGARARVDVILTRDQTGGDTGWTQALRQDDTGLKLHTWDVGGAGFGGLLETLDEVIAGGNQEWVLHERREVPGVMTPLYLLCRTAERKDPAVFTVLRAIPPGKPNPMYPLVAWRQVVGRTGCLCTNSWGKTDLRAFWADPAFQEMLNQMLDFVTATATRNNLVLNMLENEAELVWVGLSAPPGHDLRLSAGGAARLDKTGRWLLDTPRGEELLVFDGEVLLQRIPLPDPVAVELKQTGDDEAFFQLAEQAGVRVVGSLKAWNPRKIIGDSQRPTDVTWAAALLALALLVAGFAVRRR
jgi:hypothetical protein